MSAFNDIVDDRLQVSRSHFGIRFNLVRSLANIGIYQMEGGNRAQLPKPSTHKDSIASDSAVVFITNDINAVTAKVTAAGYPIISPPMVLFPKEGAQKQTREMMFRDHDGMLVNLIELGLPRPW
jgi:hypothetical protein